MTHDECDRKLKEKSHFHAHSQYVWSLFDTQEACIGFSLAHVVYLKLSLLSSQREGGSHQI